MKTLFPILGALLVLPLLSLAQTNERPNILWITSEDTGPNLGCYGDAYSTTPNLNRLAAKGTLYLKAWSTAPVCAPARTAIISGLYPSSTGAEHMRSLTRMPTNLLMYPQYLRQAGYYCSNNNKEDYNLEKPEKPVPVWDDSSAKAHWKNRRPDQPFFAIFNHLMTHESQIRNRDHKLVHDPAQVRVPAYHPDTSEVRRDWAQYYDKITEMDVQAGENLKELEAAGLADSTIVFYYGDHGPGMPRCKRYPYNSGLQVGLIVYLPEKFKSLAAADYTPGGKSERLVGFVDLAPTVLSLAGLKPPSHFQGQAFLGRFAEAPPAYVYGLRGRMDERYDLVRSVRDQRYVYLRNYMPHKIYGQFVEYMFQTPTTQVWKRLFDEGKLTPPKTYFWGRKPPEELYDLQTDPDEVNNLAGSPEHQEILQRLRQAQHDWVLHVRDVGFLPEGEIHSRSEGSTPYDLGHDSTRYPLERILATADLASRLKPEALPDLVKTLQDADSAVRYWAALGILMRGKGAIESSKNDLVKALADNSPYVRIVAAEALGEFGDDAASKNALAALMELAAVDKNGVYVSMAALNALDSLRSRIAPFIEAIKALPRENPQANPRINTYVARLLDDILAEVKK